MIYEKHNFGGNYSSANGVKDSNSLQDILLNRLVDAILKDKQKFINALNAVGVKASDNLSNQEVLKLVIANSAALKEAGKYSNADSLDIFGAGSLAGGIGAIVGGIDSLFNPNKQLNIEQEKTRQLQLQLQAAQIMASKGGGALGLSRGAWIGIGVGAVLLITIIVIATRKK